MAIATPQSSSLSGRQLAGYVALCLIWGTTWLGIRLVVRDVPPFEALAFRLFAAGVLLLAMALAQKRRWPTDRGEWNAILILTLTIMALPYALLFWAEQYITSSMSAVLYSASPLAVSLITPAMMHRKVPRRAVYAMVMAFGGSLVLFYENPSTNRMVDSSTVVQRGPQPFPPTARRWGRRSGFHTLLTCTNSRLSTIPRAYHRS